MGILTNKAASSGSWSPQAMFGPTSGPVLIVVGIKKEKEKNSQKGKKKRERKGFPQIYYVVP